MPRKKKTGKPAAQSSRKQQSSKRKQPKGKQTPRHDSAEPPMPPRFMMERTMGEMFGLGGGPQFDAQDLAYDAMEAMETGDFDRAFELAEQAANMDPGCVDALMVLAELGSETENDLIENVTVVVERGEQVLGKRFFRENRGYFWGILETRPYMRARAGLASLLQRTGRTDEAIEHYEALLDLNPDDNQGLRYGLLGLYLESDRLQRASALFEQYEGEWSAMFKWSRVLERFLNGDRDGALAALAEARESNAHVEPLLVGRKPIPRDAPDCYSPGDEREAAICMNEIGSAWHRHPESIAWLKEQR